MKHTPKTITGLAIAAFFTVCVFAAGAAELSKPATGDETAVQLTSRQAPVLYDPFDRENPVVKLPGIALTYIKGHNRDTAIYFDGKTYLREPALTFVPAGNNWIEGTVEFWIKPSAYPPAPNNSQIILFNWNDYPNPPAGYVGDISLTPEGKIVDSCGWEWGGGNPPCITSASSVPLGTWTNVAIVWSKTEGYTRLYINNSLDAEIEMYCARGSNGIIYPWLSGYGGFTGAIDELKIYNAPMNAPFYGKQSVYTAKKPVEPYVPKPDKQGSSAVANIRDIPDFESTSRDNDFAVIIGIETYQNLPASDYSKSDAGIVKDYIKALGFPERNIEFIIDEKATLSGIMKSIEAWLPNKLKKGGKVVVYYSGHGSPNPVTGEAFIVPYDGDPNYLDVTGYPLKRLYEKLGRLQVSEVIVVLDSCFSGAGGRSVLAKGARPLVMTSQGTVLPQNMVVLSATQGSQISTSSQEKGHGIFTYYFLKALKDGKKSVSEIYEHIKPCVEDDAKSINVQQSPSINPHLDKLKGRFLLRK